MVDGRLLMKSKFNVTEIYVLQKVSEQNKDVLDQACMCTVLDRDA